MKMELGLVNRSERRFCRKVLERIASRTSTELGLTVGGICGIYLGGWHYSNGLFLNVGTCELLGAGLANDDFFRDYLKGSVVGTEQGWLCVKGAVVHYHSVANEGRWLLNDKRFAEERKNPSSTGIHPDIEIRRDGNAPLRFTLPLMVEDPTNTRGSRTFAQVTCGGSSGKLRIHPSGMPGPLLGVEHLVNLHAHSWEDALIFLLMSLRLRILYL